MRRFHAILPIALTALLVAPEAAQAESTDGAKVVELAKGLYTITGWPDSGNPAFFVTGEGVVVFDSGESPQRGRAIAAKVRETTDRPIKYLVLTHYHGDHTYGLQSFPDGTIVIGSHEVAVNILRFNAEEAKGLPSRLADTQKRLAELGKETSPEARAEEQSLKGRLQALQQLADLQIRYPDITFQDRLGIHLGGKTLEVIRPGRTHTSCSCVVRIPDLKAVIMGDMLFNYSHPYIDYDAGSDTERWMEFLRESLTWDLDVVVPGHGPAGGKKHIERQIQYLADLRKEVEDAIRKGMTIEEAKKAVTMDAYREYEWPEGLTYGIEAVYRELKRTP
ncbi:MAG: MBL fold metallo-hydrolase [Acidobacteriota bacterium]